MSMFHKTRGANDKTHPPTFDEQLVPHLVPGEEARQPIELTPLGERLVGLVAWEESGIIARGVSSC